MVYLSDEDLCRVRETCSQLRATCDCDVVWTNRCSFPYGIYFTPNADNSARMFYQKTLRAFVKNGLLRTKAKTCLKGGNSLECILLCWLTMTSLGTDKRATVYRLWSTLIITVIYIIILTTMLVICNPSIGVIWLG